jgi:voltage-gated potassium channel Kch
MSILVKLFILSVVVVLFGTILIYSLEYNEPNSEIKSLEDALWWCVQTVTTVGYGDIVPVTSLGRYVAMAYMGFGIAMITTLIYTITTNFYKKRIEAEERKKDKYELDIFKNQLMNKLSDLEQKQNQCLDLFNQLHSKNDGKLEGKT